MALLLLRNEADCLVPNMETESVSSHLPPELNRSPLPRERFRPLNAEKTLARRESIERQRRLMAEKRRSRLPDTRPLDAPLRSQKQIGQVLSPSTLRMNGSERSLSRPRAGALSR